MRDKKGEVTVFVTLLMTAMVSAFLVIVRAGLNHSMEFMTECSADAGMMSALGEYHRELYNQYGLLFIDTAYMRKAADTTLLADHIEDYMSDSLRAPSGTTEQLCRDLLDMRVNGVNIDKETRLTDLEGDVLVRAATQEMLLNADTEYLNFLESSLDGIQREIRNGDIAEEKRRQNREDFEKAERKLKKLDEDTQVDNPLECVEKALGSGIIDFVKPDGSIISDRSFRLSEYISHRSYEEAEGFICNERPVSALENAAFVLYLNRKCKSAVETYEEAPIRYELEYILSGRDTDRENLEAVAGRLLLLKTGTNYFYLVSDRGKMTEIELLASGISAITLVPELEPVIKTAMTLAWAYTESLNDIKALLRGKRVPLIKDSEGWKTGLLQALAPIHVTGESVDRGLSYTDYLSAFLLLMDRPVRNFRFLDVVEMNMRSTKDNEYFRVDLCVKDFTATAVTQGRGDKTVMITRTYGYEK